MQLKHILQKDSNVNYFVKFFLSFFILTSPLIAFINSTNPQSNWDTIKELQRLLNEKFYEEEPFFSYARTKYGLRRLSNQMQLERLKKNVAKTNDIVNQLLTNTNELIDQLDIVSHDLLMFLINQNQTEPDETQSQTEPDETQPDETAKNNEQIKNLDTQVLSKFISTLLAAQNHLTKYSKYFAPQNQQNNQNQAQQPPQQPNYPSQNYQNPYGYPPQYAPQSQYSPYPNQYQLQQEQQLQEAQSEKIKMILMAAACCAAAAIGYLIFNALGRADIFKEIEKRGKEIAKIKATLVKGNFQETDSVRLRSDYKTLADSVKNYNNQVVELKALFKTMKKLLELEIKELKNLNKNIANKAK